MSAFDLGRFAARKGKPNYVTKDGKTYVEREGRLIEIETQANTKTKAAKTKHKRSHIGCPWGYLEDVCRLTDGRATALMAVYIYRRTVVCKHRTVTLPGRELAGLGVSRSQKSRGLMQLARTGIIRIEDNASGRTARVTLLWEG